MLRTLRPFVRCERLRAVDLGEDCSPIATKHAAQAARSDLRMACDSERLGNAVPALILVVRFDHAGESVAEFPSGGEGGAPGLAVRRVWAALGPESKSAMWAVAVATAAPTATPVRTRAMIRPTSVIQARKTAAAMVPTTIAGSRTRPPGSHGRATDWP